MHMYFFMQAVDKFLCRRLDPYPSMSISILLLSFQNQVSYMHYTVVVISGQTVVVSSMALLCMVTGKFNMCYATESKCEKEKKFKGMII